MLRVLRLGEAVEDRRGHHRDAGDDPAPVEGDPDGAREVHLPGLREDRPAAGAVSCDAAGLGGPQPAGDDPVREVRGAPASEPPARPLRARRRRSQPVDPGRPGRRVRHWAGLGLCARRRAVRRPRSAGGAVPLLAGPLRRSPGGAPEDLRRHPSGRHLFRLQRPLCSREIARARHRGCMLGAWSEEVLRARRWRWRR